MSIRSSDILRHSDRWPVPSDADVSPAGYSLVFSPGARSPAAVIDETTITATVDLRALAASRMSPTATSNSSWFSSGTLADETGRVVQQQQPRLGDGSRSLLRAARLAGPSPLPAWPGVRGRRAGDRPGGLLIAGPTP